MNGKKKKWLAMGMICALLLTLGNVSTQVFAKETNSAEWMAGIEDERMLSEISIPGTHDTCTQFVSMGYIFKCQDTSVSQQLQNGYRYMDLRLVIDDKEEPELIIKHNFAKCKKSGKLFADALSLEDVLEDVYEFLEEHPSETVILCMKAENSKDDVRQVQDLLYEQIAKEEEMWYLENRIPALEEVRGKIVLAKRFHVENSSVTEERRGLNFSWKDQGDTEIVEDPYVLSMINEEEKLWVQDRFNYDTADKIDAVVEDMENCQAAEDSFSLNFTSTSGSKTIGHPKKYATEINNFLLSYDWQQDTNYGIIVVDFGTEELAEKIYKTNE